MKTSIISSLLVLLLLNACSTKSSNPIITSEILPTFPHTYHGTSAYYAGDTLGTDFGVAITRITITRADTLFNAFGTDTLKQTGVSVSTDFSATGQSTNQTHLQYNVAFDDGSTGIAVFNSVTKDSLTITLGSYLTTKFGTPYQRIYKVVR